jgi:hypothetical protein
LRKNKLKVFAGGSRGGSFFKKRPPWPPEAKIGEKTLEILVDFY